MITSNTSLPNRTYVCSILFFFWPLSYPSSPHYHISMPHSVTHPVKKTRHIQRHPNTLNTNKGPLDLRYVGPSIKNNEKKNSKAVL